MTIDELKWINRIIGATTNKQIIDIMNEYTMYKNEQHFNEIYGNQKEMKG